ncbi:MAG: hypothetical protein QM478_01070 [Flavobacteriaceae bacterium]
MTINKIESLLNSKFIIILIFTVFGLIIFSFSFNFGFFWDNLLFASKIGNHFYYDGLFNWVIPNNFDSGHPPTFGFLLAIFWNMFGRSLLVSHLLMIPISIATLYQLYKFALFFTNSNIISLFAILLIIVDPTLSANLILVNPELIQVWLFFLAINSILYKKQNFKIIALLFLCTFSLRGMMLCVGIFIFEFLNALLINKEKVVSILNKKFISSYLIGSFLGFSYLIWHYINKGWIISHPNYPWGEHRHFVSLTEFLRNNIIVIIHRYLDFGRVFIFILLLYVLIKYKNKVVTKKTKQLFLLATSSISIVVLISIFSTNPMGHRYFLVSYITFNFLSFYIIIKWINWKKSIYLLLIFGLISGNFWIYPKDISQGWDSSLAHIPYYELRKNAIKYLDENNIEINGVATFFPNTTTLDNVDLNNNLNSFIEFDGTNEYTFYSNVYNLSDLEYSILDSDYKIVKSFTKNNIHIYIYKLK